MSTTLKDVLDNLNEEKESMVDITMDLFNTAMFDDDGEFRGWESNAYRIIGKSKIDEYWKKLRRFIAKTTDLETSEVEDDMVFNIIYSAGEGEIEDSDDLEETIKIVYEELG